MQINTINIFFSGVFFKPDKLFFFTSSIVFYNKKATSSCLYTICLLIWLLNQNELKLIKNKTHNC